MFRTIALTGFAALVAATMIALAPPARAQIGNSFSDPAPPPPGHAPPRHRQATRRRRGSAAAAAGPVVADAQASAAGAGRPASRIGAVAATGAAARHDSRSAEHPIGYRGSAAATRSGR